MSSAATVQALKAKLAECQREIEQLRAERRFSDASANQQRLLAALFDAAPTGLAVITGPDLRVRLANAAYRSLTPHPEIEPTGRLYTEIWPPAEGFDKGVAWLRQVLDTRQPLEVPHHMRCFWDGSPHYFSFRLRPVDWGDQPAILVVLSEITAQQLAAQEARKRTAELEALFDAIGSGLVIYDAAGRIIRENTAATEMLRYSAQDLSAEFAERVTRTRAVTMGEDASPRPEDMPTMRALRGEKVHNQLMCLHGRSAADGGPLWVLTNTFPISGSDGEITGAVASFSDVTMLRRTEERLRSAQDELARRLEEMQALFDLLPAAIAIADDPQCQTMRGNAAFYQMLGISPDANGSMSAEEGQRPTNFRVFRDGRELQPDELTMQLAAATGQAMHDQLMELHHADGRVVVMLGSAVPLFDAEGQPRGSIGVFLDIAERQAAEAERQRLVVELQARMEEVRLQAAKLQAQNDRLQELNHRIAEQEARYRAMGETVPFGIWVCAPDGGVIYMSRSYLEMVGRTLEESKQFGWTDRLPPEDVERTVRDWTEHVKTGEPWDYEHRIKGADGGYRAILSRGVPLRDRQGHITSWVGINLDITERKRLEQALRQAKEELELRIQERTAELWQANEALEAGREQLRALSRRLVEAIEEQQRTIARELHDEAGQALTALQLGLGQLKRHCPTEHGAHIEQMLQVTDQVMEGLHRLAVNLRPVSLDRYGLVPALQQYVEAFQGQTGIPVRFVALGVEQRRLAPEAETVIYRVVQEALTNVARHSGAQSVGVIVERHDRRATAIIEDDGRGFDVEEAMKRSRLGLVGMRERAEMLGGTLTIESAPGKGTTVFVNLPAGPANDEQRTF